MSRALFFYGTLCHLPLLEIVLGRDRRDIDICAAQLPDHLASWVRDEPFPMIEAKSGASAHGILVQGLSETDIARLKFYEGGFAYDLSSITVQTAQGSHACDVFFPEPDLWRAGAVWDLDAWALAWGAITLSAAREVMEHFGELKTRDIAHLLPFFRARAWAKQLAQKGAPIDVRRSADRREVTVTPRSGGYAGFFRLETFAVSYPKFDGAQSETLERSAFVAYDAALLLPYDPVRDLVMLVEQMRYGPLLRGDPNPWVLEPIAGLVDAGEPPIETARREAIEEAGLEVDDIRPMLQVYASPGYSTEFFHCFLGLCALDASQEGVHGLVSEHEDIRSHVMSFERAMALLDSGEINQSPLAIMLLWLARKREQLRAQT